MPRFAANLTMMFTEVPFLERFAEARDAGFSAVEFLFPYEFEIERVGDALERSGLELALFNLPPGDWASGERGFAALPGKDNDFYRSVDKALAYAHRLKPKYLHVMAGNADPEDHDANSTYRKNLTFAAQRADEIGVGITIEPLNRRDMPGYFLRDFSHAAAIIKEVDRRNLFLQFDIYHRQILHGDVLTGLEKLMPVIGHVQVASVPDRHEPGTGELNDKIIFAKLDTLGYQGLVGCEYRPLSGTINGLEWINPFRKDPKSGGR